MQQERRGRSRINPEAVLERFKRGLFVPEVFKCKLNRKTINVRQDRLRKYRVSVVNRKLTASRKRRECGLNIEFSVDTVHITTKQFALEHIATKIYY